MNLRILCWLWWRLCAWHMRRSVPNSCGGNDENHNHAGHTSLCPEYSDFRCVAAWANLFRVESWYFSWIGSELCACPDHCSICVGRISALCICTDRVMTILTRVSKLLNQFSAQKAAIWRRRRLCSLCWQLFFPAPHRSGSTGKPAYPNWWSGEVA